MPLPSPFATVEGEELYMKAYDRTMALWPRPFQTIEVEGGFGRTHVAVSGPKDAPPMVLLHGFGVSLGMWGPNVTDYARTHRVFAVDVVGQPGKSVPRAPMQTRDDCAAWLNEVLDGLGLDAVTLVGMSFGGFLALNHAQHSPQRVKKLVLLSPVGGFREPSKEFYLRSMLLAWFPRHFVAERLTRWWTTEVDPYDTLWHLWRDRVAEQMRLGVKHFHARGGVLPTAFTDDELRALRVPTLLLVGDQDVLYDPFAAVERAKRLVPDIEAALVPGANHDMCVSQRHLVDPLVVEFVDRGTIHPTARTKAA